MWKAGLAKNKGAATKSYPALNHLFVAGEGKSTAAEYAKPGHVAPEVIEDLVLKAAEVGEVGVCSIENADGIEEICIAVSSPRDSDSELLRRITDAFLGFQFGRFHVIKLAALPRTPSGKLQRKHLKEIVAASLRTHSPGAR